MTIADPNDVASLVAALPSAVSLPTIPGNPNYTMRAKLDGRDFNFVFQWNQREEAWHMSIAQDDDTPLISGVKIITNTLLTATRQWDERMPPGPMIAVDTTANGGADPGLYELGIGQRVVLVYFPLTDG